MGTVNSLMDLARQTLMSDQAALNVVSNNVANQNTPGYTRQVVSWQSRDSVQIGAYTVGQGVSVGATGVSQRDRVLEQRLQQQIQDHAQSDSFSSIMGQIEDVFSLSATSTSASSTALGSAMDSFFNSLSSLSSNPSDDTTRQAVFWAAINLVGVFNSTTTQLNNIASDLNKQVMTTADSINSLTATIAALNQRISSTSPDQDAGVLEDQRQQAIEQLSQYIGLNQITNENNSLTLTTSNGAVLVSGGNSYALSTTTVGSTTHLLVGNQDITSGLTGGSLGGILQARDQAIPSYQSSLDNLAYSLATQINQINSQGLDGNGNTGQAIFAIPGSPAGAAAQIQLATIDPKSLAAAAVGEGSTGNSNALLLANVATSAVVGGQTAMSFLSTLLARIGTTASDATTAATTKQTMLSQLTAQRNSLSSVSLDEEAANLTAYQRAYEAAAKVFSIANDLMASAINLGTETSVS